MRIAGRGVLLAILSLGLASQDRYAPLKKALGMTDSQAWQLNAAQQSKLADIAKILQRYDRSASAVVLGLMDAEEWPAGWPCPPVHADSYVYSREFDLTPEQARSFERLQQDVRQRAVDQMMESANRYGKMLPGERIPPSEWAALKEETSRLVKQRDEARPPRDLAMAVLSETQRTRLAALRSELELAREALNLHLIQVPPLPEILCH